MFAAKEGKTDDTVMMLFWEVLRCEERIVIQGTEGKKLHSSY